MPTESPTTVVRDVEIVRVGNWASALSGKVPVTADDLQAMVNAAQDPEIDHAPVKIGHVDPRFDGEPAFGWLTNIRQQGDRIIADIADVPRQMAHLVTTAFKRRSAEIAWGVKTPSGKTYKAALAGLALLGVTPPAVKGLADIVSRYSGPTNDAETRGTVTIVDGDDSELAGLHATAINAQAAFDARRAFLTAHSGDLPAIPADPELNARPTGVAMTDEEVRAKLGLPAEVPVTDQLRGIADAQAKAEADAAAAKQKADEDAASKAKADADAQAEAERKAAEEAAKAAAAAGNPTMTVDKAAFEQLQARAGQGEEAMRILNEQEREKVLTAALSGGRIAPASVDQYRKLYDANPAETKALLAGLPVVFSTVTNFSGQTGGAPQPDGSGHTPEQWDAFQRSLSL